MLRPPSADALRRLGAAADASDRELDCALSNVGILPPLDLDQIRHILAGHGVTVSCTRNPDGHAIVEVFWNGDRSARIHHDGRVQLLSTAAA